MIWWARKRVKRYKANWKGRVFIYDSAREMCIDMVERKTWRSHSTRLYWQCSNLRKRQDEKPQNAHTHTPWHQGGSSKSVDSRAIHFMSGKVSRNHQRQQHPFISSVLHISQSLVWYYYCVSTIIKVDGWNAYNSTFRTQKTGQQLFAKQRKENKARNLTKKSTLYIAQNFLVFILFFLDIIHKYTNR